PQAIRRWRRAPRMELGFEPGEFRAVGEDDATDFLAVDLAVAEHTLAPALPQGRLQPLVLAIEAVDDVVARDDGRTESFERAERLTLSGRDAARERDRERSLHDYSAGASSEASASGSASGSASAAGSSTSTVGSSAAGSSSATGSASATGSSAAASSTSGSSTSGSSSSGSVAMSATG